MQENVSQAQGEPSHLCGRQQRLAQSLLESAAFKVLLYYHPKSSLFELKGESRQQRRYGGMLARAKCLCLSKQSIRRTGDQCEL
jgi:hypothetical protein